MEKFLKIDKRVYPSIWDLRVLKTDFHLKINIDQLSKPVTNSSDSFTNFVTTNLRTFSSKMNAVIYINKT